MAQNYAWDYRSAKPEPKREWQPTPEEVIQNHENKKALEAAEQRYRDAVMAARRDPDILLVLRAQAWIKAGADITWRANNATLRWDPVGTPDGWPPGIDGTKVIESALPDASR